MRQSWDGPVGPFTLRSAHGHVWTFSTLSEAAAFIARSGHQVIDRLPDALIETPYQAWTLSGVVAFDECGLPMPAWKVLEAGQGIKTPRRAFALWARGPHAYDHERDFRKAPVPGVRKRRWGRFYRRVRTQAELRDLTGLEADLRDLEGFPARVKIRGRRKTIPTTWDDIVIHGKGRGWKHHRRTQWK